MISTAVVGLGTNLGDKAANIKNALDAIERDIGKVVACSSLMENEAMLHPDNPAPQDSFFNAVALVETEQCPLDILRKLLAIEIELGRIRSADDKPWPPRIIDLDLLALDQETFESKELTIPHPGLHFRDFVLVPLVEVWPAWVHPVLKVTAQELLDVFKSSPAAASSID